MTAAAFAPAPLLAGKYVAGPQIGLGGFCQVHEAYDQDTGQKVALKRLRDDLKDEDSARERLILEGQLLKQLQHPNIVGIHGIGDEPAPFLALELLDGGRLNARQPFTPFTAVTIMGELLQALSAVHAAGIVHRDVKPGNLMLTPERCVLIDFGIAQPAGDRPFSLQTDTCAVVGTAGYFSPEQVRGETVDTRSDLFSAGVILFEMLAGEPAFALETDDTRTQSRSAIANDNRIAALAYSVTHLSPQLENRRQSLPPALCEAVAKAMAKCPADRFQSADEMAAALAAIPLPRPA